MKKELRKSVMKRSKLGNKANRNSNSALNQTKRQEKLLWKAWFKNVI